MNENDAIDAEFIIDEKMSKIDKKTTEILSQLAEIKSMIDTTNKRAYWINQKIDQLIDQK